MKSFVLFLLALSQSFFTFAIEMNQQGEKMVSDIRIEFANDSVPPYSVEFKYDSNNQICSVVCRKNERKSEMESSIKMNRDEAGKVELGIFENTTMLGSAEFKLDSIQRIAKVFYVGDNGHTDWSLFYDYDFNGFDLSILSIGKNKNEQQKRDLVRMDNGDAYLYNSDVNLQTGTEYPISKNKEEIIYTTLPNDLNIDIFQIIAGYCSISGPFGGMLDMNIPLLVRWCPLSLKSKHFPAKAHRRVMKYIYDNKNNVSTIEVSSTIPNRLIYTIYVSYVG